MDWQKLIRHFIPLENGDIPPFAPPADMVRALNTYNRAISHLRNQNTDIALIALRKLAASYPGFTLPGLLAGLVLASTGNFDQARQQISRAVASGLEPDWQEMAEHALAELEGHQENQSSEPADHHPAAGGAGSAAPLMVGATPVLEKTGRRGKVRMASAREREDVVRHGEFPQDEETHVKMGREPADYLRLAVPALAILIVAGLLVFFGIRFISGINETKRLQRDATARLDWLVSRLENLANQDESIERLLDDYDKSFTDPSETSPTIPPVTEPTSRASESTSQTMAPTPEPTASQTSSVVTTTASTLPGSQQALIQADDAYRQAVETADRDVRAAGDLLLLARTLLSDIPDGTRAPGIEPDSDTLGRQVETMIGEIARDAAEANRVLGMALFNDEQYEDALPYFLTGYAIYPRAYGGGVAYYCGLCNQMMGEYETARPYYEFVISEYPNRDIAEYARSRLSQMGY